MIYAIADLHLPSTLGKTMDRFGSIWRNHPDKIRRNWINIVSETDSVVVCGDISWAMRPEEARGDLEFIARLPGTKYLIRGNHDYWWARNNTRRLQETLPPNMILLQGEGRVVEGVGVGGTRGWQAEGAPTPKDDRIVRRELAYLRRALEELPDGPKAALLHYPPYDADLRLNAFGKMLIEKGIRTVAYGHLHLGNPNVLRGPLGPLEMQLVSADQVEFCPQPLLISR